MSTEANYSAIQTTSFKPRYKKDHLRIEIPVIVYQPQAVNNQPQAVNAQPQAVQVDQPEDQVLDGMIEQTGRPFITPLAIDK